MKKILVFILSVVTLLSVSACGSEGDYPVFLGDSYQDVYDYCKENNVEDSFGESTFSADSFSISSDLDWFGEGLVCSVEFEVPNENNDGVKKISVFSYCDNEDEQSVEDYKVKVEKILKKLIDQYGEPVGEPDPQLDAGTQVVWNKDSFNIDFSYNEDEDLGASTLSVTYEPIEN